MKFVKGRENLSVTVYVPFDCQNNCKFCSSKKEYEIFGTNLGQVKEQLKKVRNSSINEVVFTGGEPMSNLEVLKDLIKLVDNKDVYINTTFIKKDIYNFVRFVNSTECIKGVNISRHSISYEEDCKTLCNIAPDDCIAFIEKPVKINAVISDNVINGITAKGILQRWEDFSNVRICFRSNFNNTTKESLHDLSDVNIKILSGLGNFDSRSYCDVCDTITFTTDKGQKYSYHRGLPTTAIEFADIVQVNDVIIYADGEIAFDWDRDMICVEEMCKQFGIVYQDPFHLHKIDIDLSHDFRRIPSFSMNCGGQSYGMCGSGYGGFGSCGSSLGYRGC